jgi:hypothetical protein
MKKALASDHLASMQKEAWSYDQTTKLYTSKDPMQKFACPGCGTEQDHLGFTHCAGCDRTWNSWPVRQQTSAKTGASTYMLMAREIKMRGDQFKLAAAGNVKIADSDSDNKKDSDKDDDDNDSDDKGEDSDNDFDDKMEKDSSAKVAGPMMPTPGTMPGDNSGATGAPMAPAAGPTPQGPPGGPMPGDADNDNDVAGGITEGSPIDQIQDALEGAVMALKDVQMLSINPVLAKTASVKVAALRAAMDRFWTLHRQMNYVAGMLAKEANEALRATDPRISSEAEFVRGYHAAAKNQPLPPSEKTGRAYLEGYVAFHKQADSMNTGGDIAGLFEPTGMDESTGGNEGSDNHDGAGPMQPANEIRSDAGPYDSNQPASRDFARNMDADNSAGQSRGDQGESSSIQPTSSRRSKR